MRQRLRLVLALAMVLVSGACWAANRTPVTLRAQDTSVQPLLRMLLERGGCSFVVGSDVPDDYIRGIAIVNVPFDVALRSLAKYWKFGYSLDDRVCSVSGSGSGTEDALSRDLRYAELRSNFDDASFRDFRSAALHSNRETPAPTKKRNTYYLVRRGVGSSKEAAPERVGMGPRDKQLEPELVAYADTISRLVTPDTLDDLAARLKQQVDDNPGLRQKLASEQVGLTQFCPINVQSRLVAMNVAEDLSTSMIMAGFHLVERAQLDKACAELHLQDTAIIDPATACKLGQMTGCGILVVGSISDRGSLIVINARLVETATGKALAADRVMIPKRDS